MSNRFHNKYHRHNHHTRGTDRTGLFPDSGYDPLASPDSPFQGEFFVDGDVTSMSGISAQGDLWASNGLFHGSVVVEGNLDVLGDTTQLDTHVYVTSAFEVTNTGTDIALKVTQTGSTDVALFKDDAATAMIIKNGGNVGIGTATPSERLTIVGNLSSVGNNNTNGQLVVDGNTEFRQDNYLSGSGFVRGNLTVDHNLTVDTDTLFVDSAINRIGVHTLFPNKELTVIGSISASDNLFVDHNVNISGSTWLSGSQFMERDLIVNKSSLVVDTLLNRVGINTSTPNEELTLVGNLSTTGNTITNGSSFLSGDDIIDGYQRVTGSTFVSGSTIIDGTLKVRTLNTGATNYVATHNDNTIQTREANYRIWDTTAEFLSSNNIGVNNVPVYSSFNTLSTSPIRIIGGNTTISNNLSVENDLIVKHDLEIDNNTYANGFVTISKGLSVGENATFVSNLTAKQNVTVFGNLTAQNITVVENLSTGGHLLGQDANSWNRAFAKVSTLSANWNTAYDAIGNELQIGTAKWDSNYETVNALSANWNSVYSYVGSTSANIDYNIGHLTVVCDQLSAAISTNAGVGVSTVSLTGSVNVVNFNVMDQTTLYYTESATGPFILNVRTSDSVPLNDFLHVNQAISIKFINTNGATARQLYAFQVDGHFPTINFANGNPTVFPSSNANSVDYWTFTIIKKAENKYNVLGEITRMTAVQKTQVGADIDGETAGDESGTSVALNATGDILAVGARKNDGTGQTDIGSVRVYSWDHSSWNKIGSDIDGELAGDESGISVSLNAAGTRVAIGAHYNDGSGSNAGSVRIYDNINGTWTKVGSDIDGQSAGDEFGISVSLNASGDKIAIGSIHNSPVIQNPNNTTTTLTNAGCASVYQWNGVNWAKIGSNINGEAVGDEAGISVSLNAAGDRIAVGAHYNDESGNNAGSVRVYEWQNSAWTPMGATVIDTDIDGEAAGDESGYSVSLNAAGDRVAIGAPGNDGLASFRNDGTGGVNSGHVRVYEWDSMFGMWNQMGFDIDGEAAGDNSGISVSINSAGDRVAIGATYNDDGGVDSGHTRIYEWDSTNGILSWLKLCTDVDGEAANDRSGYSVALNSAGERVAIGAPLNDNTSSPNAGHVRVYNVYPNTAYPPGKITLVSQPNPVQLEVNQQATFTVASTTTPQGTLTYQWKKNGRNVGTNSPTYNVTETALMTNSVKCVIKNINYGTTAITTPVQHKVVSPEIRITAQPQPLTVTQGLAYTFSVTAETNSGTLSYVWTKNGDQVGDNSPVLTLTEENIGTYQIKCAIHNSYDPPGQPSVDTNTVSLNVIAAIVTINTQPTSISKAQGVAATFSIDASTLSGVLQYQWTKDGVNVGTNSPTYTVTEHVKGSYDIKCTVTNVTYGWVAISTIVQLTVTTAVITITSQPVNVSKEQGVASTFYIGATTEAGELSYQWKQNGINVGEDSDTLTLHEETIGSYSITCVVTNVTYNVVRTSNTAILTTTIAVVRITSQPQSVSREQGVSATFSVVANTGAGNLSYQWKNNGVNVGTDSSSYTIAEGVIGSYAITCVITNTTYNVNNTTSTATLQITTAVVYIDLQPVSISKAQGYVHTFNTAAHTGAGDLAYQWRKNGIPVAGETNTSYSLSETVLGAYAIDCVITNTTYNVSSTTTAATLTIVDGVIRILAQPSRVIVKGPNQVATFGIAAYVPAGTLTYQWYNGQGVAVTTAAIGNTSYTTSSSQVDIAPFYCVVRNITYGPTATSITATLITSWSFPSNNWSLVFSDGPTTYAENYDYYRDIAYGARKWVLVGAGGYIKYSSNNGDTWSEATNGFGSNDINALVYRSGRFMAVGTNGSIFTSTNGTTWTAGGALPGGSSQELLGVNYSANVSGGGSGVWVTYSSTQIWTSDDNGTSWTSKGNTFKNLQSIATDGKGKWIILPGGLSNSTDIGQFNVISIDNGSTWSTLDMNIGGIYNTGTAATLLDDGRLSQNRSITYAPTQNLWYYAANQGNIWKSADGTNWYNVVNSISNVNARGVVEAPAGGLLYIGQYANDIGNTTLGYILSSASSTYTYELIPGYESQNLRTHNWSVIESSIYVNRAEAPATGKVGIKKLAYGQGYWMAIDQPDYNNYNRVSRSPTVGAVPEFTLQPTNVSVSQSNTATFNVAAQTTSGGTLTYTWYKNEAVVGTDSNQYTVNETTNGTYSIYCSVMDSVTKISTYSDVATLTVTPEVINITLQPAASISRQQGVNATFSIAANSIGGVAYQWQKDGVNIPNATNSSVTISEGANGNYNITCVVTNPTYGTVLTSSIGVLTITPAVISITTHPQSVSKQQGVSATFTAAATSEYPVSYQWKKDGVNVGTNSTSYTVAEGVIGTYSITCVVTNLYGNAVTTNAATLTVTTAVVTIDTQPTSLANVGVFQTVTFSIVASTAAGTLAYQWKRNGVNIAAPAGTSSTLSITEEEVAVYNISCVVTNTTYNVSATSNTVTLEVISGEFILDPYFNSTELILNGEVFGGLASQNNTFSDSSSNTFTITRNGNVTQGTTTPFSPYGWSSYFNGTTDYLSVASNAAFGYGTGDFTMECWFSLNALPTGTNGAHLIDQRTADSQVVPTLYVYSDGSIKLFVSGAERITGGSVLLNKWYHVAISKRSGITKMYLDGVQIGSSYTDSNTYITSPVYIGTKYNATQMFNGYISNLRLTKGQGLYTGAFTPSTTALTISTNGNASGGVITPTASNVSLLTLQNNSFVDNSI